MNEATGLASAMPVRLMPDSVDASSRKQSRVWAHSNLIELQPIVQKGNHMTPDQTMKVLRVDADGLAANTGPALVVLDISRSEIERCHIASALERLHVLTDTAENTRRYKGSLTFVVAGYDEDPRELPQIPEVVAYFRALTSAWPHWLWFTAPNLGVFPTLFSLLCNGEVVANPAGGVTHLVADGELKARFANLMFRGMPLYETYQLDEDEVEEVFISVLDELGLS